MSSKQTLTKIQQEQKVQKERIKKEMNEPEPPLTLTIKIPPEHLEILKGF